LCSLNYYKEEEQVKKLIAIVMLMFVAVAMGVPAFAGEGPDSTATSTESMAMTDAGQNVKTGSENTATGGLDEIIKRTSDETAKAEKNNIGEQSAGLIAGGAIGVRKGIHRTGAGVIDLLTFWIPKKQPLVTPEKAPLE
jgi:hypothetical protein